MTLDTPVYKTSITCLMLLSLLIASLSCRKSHEAQPDKTIQKGTLYYSAADELIKFDFSSHQEVLIFSNGADYKVSPDGGKFSWYKNNFSEKETTIQIHDTDNPSNFQSITLPYILESTPDFAPGTTLLGALTASIDEPLIRNDLSLFNYQGEVIGHIPHVKDFAFAPNGNDLIISAEALNGDGKVVGYALALIKDYHSADQQSITIREFANYNQLPIDMAVSPNSSLVAYTHLDHLYTLMLKEGSEQKKITESRFSELDVNWSPDGKFLIFAANCVGTSNDCGEIRIIPSQSENTIQVPEDGWDNAPVDSLQPVDNQGKVVHSCGSESIFWIE